MLNFGQCLWLQKEVLPCQGEMFLCEVCEYVRFRELSTRKPKSASTATTPKSASTPAKTEVVGSVKSTPGTVKSNSKSCKDCTKRLNETVDKPLTCGRCEHWSCRTCAKLTLAEYDVITKKASKVHWFCMDCDEEAMAAVKASSQLFNEYTEQVNCRLDKMEGNLTNKADGSVVVNLCKRMDALSALVEELRGKPVSPESTNPVTMGNQRTNEMEGQRIDDLQDRIARKNNIIFFGVSEAEGTTREDKMANNKAKIMRIANEVGMQLKEEDILSFKRLGKMGQTRVIEDEEVPVPRLLLATFTEAAKASLMKNAYKLQFSSEMKEIRIKHDMSKEDRQKEYGLRQEARQKQMGDSNQGFLYRLRGPNWDRKIVKLRKFVSKPVKEPKETPAAADNETENQD